ncbi:hypothetical protein B0T24DRAFT_622325 [Lasiosphaeria ovina]|uniref:Uncharacterized protein n=1 Tax=Lasiosphaeria ovina TaxID=92902 RepID=A0AAE0KBR8_9PEZI|nr:hypothetical protein B0T24DRAFT_622325 [Lasiosphaeria ovina]
MTGFGLPWWYVQNRMSLARSANILDSKEAMFYMESDSGSISSDSDGDLDERYILSSSEWDGDLDERWLLSSSESDEYSDEESRPSSPDSLPGVKPLSSLYISSAANRLPDVGASSTPAARGRSRYYDDVDITDAFTHQLAGIEKATGINLSLELQPVTSASGIQVSKREVETEFSSTGSRRLDKIIAKSEAGEKLTSKDSTWMYDRIKRFGGFEETVLNGKFCD